MLDPACGDGRFLVCHANSVGVEQDPDACTTVYARTHGRLIHQGEFFSWAERTQERFDCAAGNPPFIRYQRFSGATRDAALRLCRRHGAAFSALTSSWGPFLVATAALLRRGGRMAFVVPAEIGHAPYAAPLLEFMMNSFAGVQLVAIREKFFSELSEDCWLLYAQGFGEQCDGISLSLTDRFDPCTKPPAATLVATRSDLEKWSGRVRPFLLPSTAREAYRHIADSQHSIRLGDVARVRIGYVTGANDFFHLRPSQARRLQIPRRLLHPAVRNGKCLAGRSVDTHRVRAWMEADEPILLLRLRDATKLPEAVRDYLDTEQGQQARQTYKCRNRKPWYVVPDVTVPDGFLSYMSGEGPRLVENAAGCVCTNSVHALRLTNGMAMSRLVELWATPLTRLSCEIEGHPLGGGMLKVEPREAARIVLADRARDTAWQREIFCDALTTMKRWRHYGG